MEQNKGIGKNPEIVVSWDIWDQTWLLNKIMRSSNKYAVNAFVEIQPGSLTLILKVLATAADIIGVSLFFKSVSDYIRYRREKRGLSPPSKNQDSAYFEAIGHLILFEDIQKPKLETARRIDKGYEFIFTDETKRSYKFIILDNCTFEYTKI